MPTQKIIARRRRASTYITRRFHRPGTLAAPDQSPTRRLRETNPKQNARHRRATPIFNPGLSAGVLPHPKNAKRTQSQRPPRLKSAKRTQFHPRRTCGGPKNAKRTQSQPTVPPNYRNEPNSTTPTAKKCKTNPIYRTAPLLPPRPHQHYLKAIQFT